jgi:hypothetical protein
VVGVGTSVHETCNTGMTYDVCTQMTNTTEKVGLGTFNPKTENQIEPKRSVGFIVLRFGFGFYTWEVQLRFSASVLGS